MQLSSTLTSLFYWFMQSVIVTFYQVKKRISNQLTNLFLLEKWKTVTALLFEINLESFKIDLFHICDLMNYGFAEATWAIYLDLSFFFDERKKLLLFSSFFEIGFHVSNFSSFYRNTTTPCCFGIPCSRLSQVFSSSDSQLSSISTFLVFRLYLFL